MKDFCVHIAHRGGKTDEFQSHGVSSLEGVLLKYVEFMERKHGALVSNFKIEVISLCFHDSDVPLREGSIEFKLPEFIKFCVEINYRRERRQTRGTKNGVMETFEICNVSSLEEAVQRFEGFVEKKKGGDIKVERVSIMFTKGLEIKQVEDLIAWV
jgi:hypothetical protein